MKLTDQQRWQKKLDKKRLDKLRVYPRSKHLPVEENAEWFMVRTTRNNYYLMHWKEMTRTPRDHVIASWGPRRIVRTNYSDFFGKDGITYIWEK